MALNLNLLGEREPQIYGHATLDDTKALCEAWGAATKGRLVVFRQSGTARASWSTGVQEARNEACAAGDQRGRLRPHLGGAP